MEKAIGVRAVPLRQAGTTSGRGTPRRVSWRVGGSAVNGRPILLASPTDGGRRRGPAGRGGGSADAVIVDTPDALLVVARERAEQVRGVVAELARRGRTDLL